MKIYGNNQQQGCNIRKSIQRISGHMWWIAAFCATCLLAPTIQGDQSTLDCDPPYCKLEKKRSGSFETNTYVNCYKTEIVTKDTDKCMRTLPDGSETEGPGRFNIKYQGDLIEVWDHGIRWCEKVSDNPYAECETGVNEPYSEKVSEYCRIDYVNPWIVEEDFIECVP